MLGKFVITNNGMVRALPVICKVLSDFLQKICKFYKIFAFIYL